MKRRRAARLLLVGGAGRMGRRLGRFFSRRGMRVLVCDPAGAPRGFTAAPIDAAADAEVVVVAASLSHAGAAMDEVLAKRPRGLLLDIASVKAPLLPAIARARAQGVSVASVHPMFGPDVPSFRGRELLVCDAGDAAAARRARRLFAGAGLRIVALPLAEHDFWIARTLGLAHLVGLAAASTLALARPDARVPTSTSFGHLKTLADLVLAQTAELTLAIQAANPETPAMIDTLGSELASWRDVIEGGDAEGFARKLDACRAALAG